MAQEVWRDVVGFEGRYIVSNMGNVMSLPRVRVIKRNGSTYQSRACGCTLNQSVDKYGYLYVHIGGKNRKVHRLVMDAFVGPSDLTVNHKDENKANNCLDNLEYLSVADNLRYGTGMNRRMVSAQRRAKAVCQIEPKTMETIKTYPSLVSVEQYGFCSQAVGKVCLGKRPMHKGYIWRYANADDSRENRAGS